MLAIKIDQISCPFVLSTWTEEDYEKPLSISNGDWKADFILECPKYSLQIEINMIARGCLLIHINDPRVSLISGLNKENDEVSNNAAFYIFEIYKEAMRQYVGYSRLFLNLQNIFQNDARFNELFYEDSFGHQKVSWKINEEEFKPFILSRKEKAQIHPEFGTEKLLSPEKWEKLQDFINDNPAPTKEIESLLALKQKAAWNEKRIAVIESATLIEYIIKQKIVKVLTSQGLDKKKIKEIKRSLGVFVLLNLLIPLSISREEYEKQENHINNINKLVKVRNAIIHDGLEEDKVESELVSNGIASAVTFVVFLNNKFS